jgi:hypothetical protein
LLETKGYTHECQGNTEKNDIMLRADNQWLCSWVQNPRTGEGRKDQGPQAVVRFADVSINPTFHVRMKTPGFPGVLLKGLHYTLV